MDGGIMDLEGGGNVLELGWPRFGFVMFVRGTKGVTNVRLRDEDRRIRCPKCAWEPAKEDRWSCGPGGCGHVWNTFDTAGRCPACDRDWNETACLRCGAWSPHEDW